MKLAAALFLVFLTGLFFSLPDSNRNLLVNGDFETSTNGTMPDNWYSDSKVYSLGNDAASGNHSLKYSNSDPAVYKLCTQQINLKPGNSYSAGIKVKTLNISGEDFGASFCIEWLDRDGKWLGGSYPTGVKGTKDWTDISDLVTIPDSAAKVFFCCYVRKGMTGTAWFDDAYVKTYQGNRISVLMLKPVYRGLLFPGGKQNVVLSVNLDNFDEATDGLKISSVILDSSGRKFAGNSTDVTGSRKSYEISLDASGIQDGQYFAEVKLITNSGQVLDSWTKPLRKVGRQDQPEVWFDDHKRMIVHNQKIFPLGMYWSTVNEADLKKFSQSKFNFILPYNRPTKDQMDLAQKYNIKVVYSVKDLYAGSQFVPADIKSYGEELSMLDKTVKNFKDSPALLAWYNNDEYPPEFMDRLNEHYKNIAALDPDHPVLSIINRPLQAGLYLNSTDIIGGDPYVIPKLKMDMVGETTETILKKTDYSQPVWMVIQSHNLGNYAGSVSAAKEFRSPDYEEMRCMSWQAICKGADGLIYYSFFDLQRNKDVSFETQWSNLKKIVSEIQSYSEILLSEEKADVVKAVGTGGGEISWLDLTTRKYNNKLYIFAVNNGNGSGESEFILPSNYKTVKLAGNTAEQFSLENSRFNDKFRNLEVKVYTAE